MELAVVIEEFRARAAAGVSCPSSLLYYMPPHVPGILGFTGLSKDRVDAVRAAVVYGVNGPDAPAAEALRAGGELAVPTAALAAAAARASARDAIDALVGGGAGGGAGGDPGVGAEGVAPVAWGHKRRRAAAPEDAPHGGVGGGRGMDAAGGRASEGHQALAQHGMDAAPVHAAHPAVAVQDPRTNAAAAEARSLQAAAAAQARMQAEVQVQLSRQHMAAHQREGMQAQAVAAAAAAAALQQQPQQQPLPTLRQSESLRYAEQQRMETQRQRLLGAASHPQSSQALPLPLIGLQQRTLTGFSLMELSGSPPLLSAAHPYLPAPHISLDGTAAITANAAEGLRQLSFGHSADEEGGVSRGAAGAAPGGGLGSYVEGAGSYGVGAAAGKGRMVPRPFLPPPLHAAGRFMSFELPAGT